MALALQPREVDHASRRVKPPRVVIAADHPPTRMGVRLALEGDGFVVCSEEETAPGAIAAALADHPDVCVLDVHVPGGGIEAAEAIRSRLPKTQVVMLADSEDDDDFLAALQAGADGYLPKGIDPARLGPAVRDVVEGRAALSRALTARLIHEFRARTRGESPTLARPSDNDLTRREWEVLDCLGEGLSTRRIARRLFISETTVRRHVGSILRKLDAPTREAAVKVASERSRKLNGE